MGAGLHNADRYYPGLMAVMYANAIRALALRECEA